MKNLALLLFVFVSFSQISCKKDNAAGGSNAASIVGKWTIAGAKVKYTAPPEPPAEQNVPLSGTIEFKSDGTATACITGDPCTTDKYKISGSTLTVADGDDFTTDPTVLTIQSLTANSLVLYQKEIETVMGDTITTETTITLTR